MGPSPPADATALAGQLANPRRPRLAEARTAASAAASGEQAWQRLSEHDLIPAELFRSAERRFAVVNTERSTSAVNADRLDLRGLPSTVDAAITLGGDAEAVLECERLTRILRQRLAPWGAEPARRIDWIVLTHQVPFSFRQGHAFNCALYSLELALDERGVDMRRTRPDNSSVPQFVNDVLRMNDGWAKVGELGLQVPAEYKPPPRIVNTRFDAFENPFEIALQLWSLGYVLDHSCDHELSTARLFTCVVDAPQNLLQRLRGGGRVHER